MGIGKFGNAKVKLLATDLRSKEGERDVG